MMVSSDVVWLAWALITPLVWSYIQSSIVKWRRSRQRRTFIRGGAYFNDDDDNTGTPAVSVADRITAFVVATLQWIWQSIVMSPWVWGRRKVKEYRRRRKNRRVTFAEHSSGQVKQARYYFHRDRAPMQPVVPEVHTPSPVAESSSKSKVSRKSNTPPPKFMQRRPRQQLASAPSQLNNNSSQNKLIATLRAAKTTPSTPSPGLDRRALVIQAYRTSPFLARSSRDMQVSTTPLSIQYQQLRKSKKRPLEADDAPPCKRARRIPLTASSSANLQRRHSFGNKKKRNLNSTEAWLLEEFSRKRQVKATPVPIATTTPATSGGVSTFVFGGVPTGKDDASGAPAAKPTGVPTTTPSTAGGDSSSSCVFGVTPTATTDTGSTPGNAAKPAAPFGAANDATKAPSVQLGSAAATSTPGDSKSAIQFGGAPISTPRDSSTASISFGAAPAPEYSKPSLQFGSASTPASGNTKVQFGVSNASSTPGDSNPADQVGAASTAVSTLDDTKAAFHFGGTDSTPSAINTSIPPFGPTGGATASFAPALGGTAGAVTIPSAPSFGGTAATPAPSFGTTGAATPAAPSFGEYAPAPPSFGVASTPSFGAAVPATPSFGAAVPTVPSFEAAPSFAATAAPAAFSAGAGGGGASARRRAKRDAGRRRS